LHDSLVTPRFLPSSHRTWIQLYSPGKEDHATFCSTVRDLVARSARGIADRIDFGGSKYGIDEVSVTSVMLSVRFALPWLQWCACRLRFGVSTTFSRERV
jgi:hypothetical protein